MIKTCSKCGQGHERKGQRYCKACHAAYMRDNRRKHSELSEEQKQKANCRSYSNVLEKRGILTKERCNHCGADNAQKHHNDYNEPRHVLWVCRDCHLSIHSSEGK